METLQQQYDALFCSAMDDSDVQVVKKAYAIDADAALTLEQKINLLIKLISRVEE